MSLSINRAEKKKDINESRADVMKRLFFLHALRMNFQDMLSTYRCCGKHRLVLFLRFLPFSKNENLRQQKNPV